MGVLHGDWYGESGDVVCSWLMKFLEFVNAVTLRALFMSCLTVR